MFKYAIKFLNINIVKFRIFSSHPYQLWHYQCDCHIRGSKLDYDSGLV